MEINKRIKKEHTKTAEEERIGLENKFTKIFQTSPDGIAITRLEDGKYLDVNNGYLKLFGYTLQELIGKTATDLNIWSNPGNLKLFKQSLLDHGEVNNMELPFLTKTGQIITCLLSARTIEMNGEMCIISIIRDITERKLMEDALQQSEEWSRFILEHANDGIHIDNSDDQIIQVNSRFCEMMGYSREELLKMHVSDLQAPERRNFVRNLVLTELKLHKNDPFESLNLHSSGRRIPVEISVSKVESLQGVMYISIVRDSTERKRNEELRREQEKLIRTVFDTVPVGIFVVNNEGKIDLLNPAGQQIWEGSKYVGLDDLGEYKGWWRSTGKLVLAHEWGSARAFEKGETVINEEIEIECFNGEHKIILNSAVPLYGEKGEINGAIVVNQDITEKTRSAEELRRRNDYLAALQETTYELISQLDLDLLLENITKRAAQLMQTSSAFLDLVHLDKGELIPHVGMGVLAESLNHYVKPGEGIAGLVWQTGNPLVINDYDNWEHRIPGFSKHTLNSIVGVPLLSNGEVLGVLGLAYDYSSKKVFEPEAVEFLSQFARLATIALKNARLYTIAQKELADRKVVEGALRESEHRFHQMFTGNNATMLLLDPDTGDIIDANPAASRFYGYSLEKLRTLNLSDINLSKKESIKEILNSIVEQKPGVLIFPHRLANGEERTVEVHFSSIEVSNIKILFSIVHDITERKLAESLVEQQLDELRRWHSVTLGRENRVMELKYEVNELLKKAGLPLRYAFAQEPEND